MIQITMIMFLTNINSSDQARFPHFVDTNPDGSQVTTTIITTIITIIITTIITLCGHEP